MLGLPSMAEAQAADSPLLAIDTSSPQATMRSFHAITDAIETATIRLQSSPSPATQAEVERLMQKALGMLDLREVPPTARRDAGGDAIVFLVDVLRRIEVPPLEAIPDAGAFPDVNKPASWTVPGSEITISCLMEGPKKGHFVFDAETVARAGEFCSLTKHLPLRVSSQLRSLREAQLQLHGWMVPANFVSTLPDQLKRPVLNTPLWKVIATLAIVLLLAGAVLVLRRRIGGSRNTRPDLSTEYQAPTTAEEIKLVRIWENALGVAPIGVYDDFFDLGGDSIVALQTQVAVADEFGIDLPISDFFDYTTIASLAGQIRASPEWLPDRPARFNHSSSVS
jgi:acyl carrier protein